MCIRTSTRNACASSCGTSSSRPAVSTTIATPTTARWSSNDALPCSSSRRGSTATEAARSHGEDLRLVGEGLELQRVAGRVVEEHRPLLADASGKAHIRLDHEGPTSRTETLGELGELVDLQDQTEVRHRHVVAVDRVVDSLVCHGRKMGDDLVSAEVPVDPRIRTAAL